MRNFASYIILGVGLAGASVSAALSTGCAAPAQAMRHPAPPAAMTAPPSDRHIRAQAEAELGPEAAEELPPIVREAPQPVDPGAQQLVDSMLARLERRRVDADGETRIAFAKLCNMSHADETEFIAMQTRLAEALTRAGRHDQVVLIIARADGEENGQRAHYELRGSAYLIFAGGFDQWELYLSLHPREREVTLWRGEGPVRVLRYPRPGQPQVFLPTRR